MIWILHSQTPLMTYLYPQFLTFSRGHMEFPLCLFDHNHVLAKGTPDSMRCPVPICRKPPGLPRWRWPTGAWASSTETSGHRPSMSMLPPSRPAPPRTMLW